MYVYIGLEQINIHPFFKVVQRFYSRTLIFNLGRILGELW